MEQEENVYGGNPQAEQVEKTTGREQSREDAAQKSLTALGKFKDVDALAKAYTALQAEFTRRSQRLKELERKTENVVCTKNAQTAAKPSASGAEKLREGAQKLKAEREAFDEFVARLEGKEETTPVENAAEEKLLPAEENVVGAAKGLEAETVEAAVPSGEKNAAFVAVSRENTVDAEEDLYSRVQNDEQVRLRIIGEYLSSLGKAGAPLMRGGVGAFAAPPLKARTIDEAGSMALRLFKDGRSSAQK